MTFGEILTPRIFNYLSTPRVHSPIQRTTGTTSVWKCIFLIFREKMRFVDAIGTWIDCRSSTTTSYLQLAGCQNQQSKLTKKKPPAASFLIRGGISLSHTGMEVWCIFCGAAQRGHFGRYYGTALNHKGFRILEVQLNQCLTACSKKSYVYSWNWINVMCHDLVFGSIYSFECWGSWNNFVRFYITLTINFIPQFNGNLSMTDKFSPQLLRFYFPQTILWLIFIFQIDERRLGYLLNEIRSYETS